MGGVPSLCFPVPNLRGPPLPFALALLIHSLLHSQPTHIAPLKRFAAIIDPMSDVRPRNEPNLFVLLNSSLPTSFYV